MNKILMLNECKKHFLRGMRQGEALIWNSEYFMTLEPERLISKEQILCLKGFVALAVSCESQEEKRAGGLVKREYWGRVLVERGHEGSNETTQRGF